MRRALFALPLLFACAGGETDPPAVDDLASGDWTLSPTERTSDCGDALPDEVEGGVVTLDFGDDGALTFTPADGVLGRRVNPFDCSVEDGAFSCIPDERTTTDNILDAAETFIQDVDGAFSGATSGEGTWTATYDCEGTDCETVRERGDWAQWPCTVTDSFTLAAP